MSAGTLGARLPARSRGVPIASPVVVRLVAFGAFALFAALRWAALEAPPARGRMALGALLALAVAVAAQLIAGRTRRVAVPAGIGLAVAAFAAILAVSGLPTRLLAPAHWDDLFSGLGQGIQTLPGIGVPYHGVDPWVRIVLRADGVLLLVLAGVLAVRSLRRERRPVGAALVLAIAYTTPVVERAPEHPYLGGIALTVLAGALLWGDRIERAYAVPAAAFVALAVAGGALAAPQLDAGKPWVDYQAIVESLSTPPSITYSWNHTYGPLHWPRDNREMVRIASKRPIYWKAVDLDLFDGVDWRQDRAIAPKLDTEIARGHRKWHETLRVTIRDLKTPAYIGAGTGIAVRNSPRFAIPSAPGTFATGSQPLRRGDSYLMDVYAPHPTPLEMAKAGSDYPSFATAFLNMALPASVGGPRFSAPIGTPSALPPAHVVFEQYGLLNDPVVVDGLGRVHPDGGTILRRSAYAPMYALARRLREETDNPYRYARAIEQRLASGYAYTEHPPLPRPGRPPLVSFLFDTHQGYCQQFSGAMALLLRMGGVPARVASGFSPGLYDGGRAEWVVHDVDAHSWVEMYFPRIGWVPFDPTPTVAPPHRQLAPVPSPPGVKPSRLPPNTRRADVPGGKDRRRAVVGSSGVVSIWVLLLGGLVLAVLAGAVVSTVRARRRPHGPPPAPELAELYRALQLTGRPPEPGVTLRGLEERYRRHAPAAAAYIAAVRLRRYAGATAPPSPEQRRALRRELADGLGFGGRLRAWWALPPGVH